MRDRVAVGVAQRHAVTLRRAIAHRGQELEGRQEGVNADPLAGQILEAGLFCKSDVLEVAAHESNNRSPYVGVRLRIHHEPDKNRNTKSLAAMHQPMDIDTAAAYAEIFGLVTILGAAVYSWYQIKEMKAGRESQGALALSEHLQNPNFIAAIIAMSSQPDITTTEEYREHHGEGWKDVVTLATTWETLGALVHRGDLDFHLVYDVYGGLIEFSHAKMLPWVENERGLYGDTRLEWFTWLAERIQEFNSSQRVPKAAYLEHQNWKPPTRKAK